MSIACKNEFGAILDHHEFLAKVYKTCYAGNASADKNSKLYRFKPEFFDIKNPFMMDSHFAKMKAAEANRTTEESEETQAVPCKKRKKRKLDDMNDGIKEAEEFQEKVRNILEKAHTQLISLARKLGKFLPASLPLSDNNIAAREAAIGIVGPDDMLRDLALRASESGTRRDRTVHFDTAIQDASLLFNTNVDCDYDVATIKSLLGSQYMIPPKCAFLMSDVSDVDILLNKGLKYDLIVLDPPWQNKSAKRKHKYRMLDNERILDLPVPELTADNCIFAIWATNKQQQQTFIKDELFKKWNITNFVQWFWLKVTKHGELVVSLDTHQKKPYEVLFIGRMSDRKHDIHGEASEPVQKIPDNYVLLSVPSSLHSHKPPLCDVLKPYLPSNGQCLELFARSLLPGWTCWGNEVLKFQHSDFYEKYDES